MSDSTSSIAFGAVVHFTLWFKPIGSVIAECVCKKPSGRRGFIDMHATSGDDTTAVVEIKCTDWDRMTSQAVVRNTRRQIKQIWDYILSELADKNQPSPGIVFPTLPRDPDHTVSIEPRMGLPSSGYDQP